MKGDFTGFQFGSTHTEDLGIIRVSGGDRYEEQLHPEIKDITAEVPGMDGQYFFGSTYGTKTFDLELAFDFLTEEQFRQLRRVFGTKKVERLIFDEEPYKYYLAKLESPIELSYICFDEPKKIRYSEANNITQEENLPDGIRMVNDGVGNRTLEKIDPWVYQEGTQRIYKGEGKITLICNYPFAKSKYKQLPVGEESADWAISSGILSSEDYEEFDVCSNNIIKIYNPGDLPTGFRLYIPFSSIPSSTNEENQFIRIDYKINNENSDSLLIYYPIVAKDENDIGILIDTNNNLIIGVSNFDVEHKTYTTTGNLYNEYIKSGYLFKIKPINQNENHILQFSNLLDDNIEIFYDYLYF